MQELDYRLLRHNKAPISSFDTKIDNRQADYRRETRNRHIQFLKTELPSLFDEKKNGVIIFTKLDIHFKSFPLLHIRHNNTQF